jgi:hypothetical protein
VSDTAEIAILTPEHALDLMRLEVEKAGPDFIYVARSHVDREDRADERVFKSCWYVTADGDRPDCLIARVLFAHGVPLTVLKLWGTDTVEKVQRDREYAWLLFDTAQVLRAAQRVQDGERPWGDALVAAQERLAGLRRPTAHA